MTTPTPNQPEELAWYSSHDHTQQENTPHAHDPNPAPAITDPTLTLTRPDGISVKVTPDDLANLPQQSISDCTIVSTGHGTSGPFCFGGVTLFDLITTYGVEQWQHADVISADNFGTRILYQEAIDANATARPILLATHCDGAPLTRDQGLIRLIVPQETDDALRQVKWLAQINIH